jgi:hypothetical protein
MSLLRNPVLILTWGLPLLAVVASFLTLGIVLTHPDGELPEQYHWEGFQLDRDFARGKRAADLHVDARLAGLEKGGLCELALDMDGTAAATLVLRVTHGTRPALDQQLTFHRVQLESQGGRTSAVYASDCRAAPSGHWRLELSDAANGWALRSSVHGSLGAITLAASSPDDD